MRISDNKYLFVHVMKTGGTSFADIIKSNFEPFERYPNETQQSGTDIFRQMEAYLHVPSIVDAVTARPDKYRIICGHVPYTCRSLLSQNYVTLTMLREPVSRTISYLKHCRRYHREHTGLPLEQIYEDEWFHASFMNN
ncbi:MAG: sulfotransferase family 2 domain-containing protein, partial [Halioglobus sp.]|nr:sulfotransferase family 2 domain-containing protein [Halioglobus sp.]